MKNHNIKVSINSGHNEIKSDYAIQWEETRSTRYKEYRRKWVENPRDFILENGPLHLDIESTNACNLKCPFCSRTMIQSGELKGNKKLKIGFLDLDLFENIINQAVEIGVYSTKLSWYGESLLHKDIVSMVKYAKEKGIEDVMLNTNAVALTKQLSEELILSGLDKIFFSFDSPYKKKYEELRVGASFEDVLENIQTFMRLREKINKGTPLTRVNFVLFKEDPREYEDFMVIFQNLVDSVSWGNFKDPNDILDKQVSNTEEKFYDFACAQLWQRMAIRWDGDVTVCCVDADKENVVGNVYRQSLKEIWQGDKYNQLRQIHQGGEYYQVPMCRRCVSEQMTKDGSY